MADPTRYRYSGSRRHSPPLLNPARASMPVVSNAGYSSYYPGDIHVQPTSRHDYRSGAVPVTTTTYTVRQDPVARSTNARDGSRVRRSSTIDSAAKRPPIIVTTKHATPSSQASSGARTGSPSRENYRSSDEGAYYAQPASSIERARSSTRQPFSATLDDDEYRRLRERTGDDRLLGTARHDPYRARPGALYNNVPHRYSTIDYGVEGYEYTKPSDLARYDLDNDRPHRSRRESFDRYYRPSVSVTTDLDRVYDQNERRLRGPPPTTRGFDKISQRDPAGLYDAPGIRMPVVPPAPEPSRRPGHLDVPPNPSADRRSTSRSRPVSLIQEPVSHSRHDDYYRTREDDPYTRDREYVHDDNVGSRGFGLRVEPSTRIIEDPRRGSETRYRDERRDRRDVRRDFEDREPRRRSDDDLEPVKKRDPEDRDRDHRPPRDIRVDDDIVLPERKAAKGKDPASKEDDQDSRKDKIRDKLATGLSIAAASIGLGSALKDKEKDSKEDKDDRASPRRRKEEPIERKRSDDEKASSSMDDYVIVDPPKERERSRREVGPESERDAKERNRKEAEARLNGEAAIGHSRDASVSADEGGKPSSRRRRRPSSAFNPNDTSALMALKAQMAANEDKEKEREKETEKTSPNIPIVKEPSPERKTSPPVDKRDIETGTATSDARDESRGRELVVPSNDEKQVRVVSPPRDKDDKKPIKGILKQPKQSFPEEPNPIREGVAPHKDDKTKTNVPTGARWTKINRKMVNPEALTLGKERFEVRDGFVIVLRVLSKEEIQMYAAVTAELRGGLQLFFTLDS
jgi:zinc finger CCCH domain-containing protein 13